MRSNSTVNLAILLSILALTQSSYQAGNCTSGYCGYCEKSGTTSYCTTCYRSKLSGVGTERKCSLDADIGCSQYKSVGDSATGQPYCSACNFGYSLKEDSDKTKNSCVKCDRALNYFTTAGECKLATFVENCAQYKPNENKCEVCKGGFDLDATNNKCIKLGANCTAMKVGTTTDECTDCASTHFFRDDKCTTALPIRCSAVDNVEFQCSACQERAYFVSAEKECKPITAAHCLRSPNNTPTECTECAPGYYLDGTTCKQIPISNCVEASSPTVCTKCRVLIGGGGYLLKSDGSKCTASNGCRLGSNYFLFTGESPQCAECDVSRNYYATGVSGSATFDLNGNSYWAQVCTKGGYILQGVLAGLVIAIYGF